MFLTWPPKRMYRLLVWTAVHAVCSLGHPVWIIVQDAQTSDHGTPVTNSIAAIVDDHTISTYRVQRHLRQTIGDRSLDGESARVARQAALEHLINRHLVFAAIKEQGMLPSQGQINMELSKLNDRLKEVNKAIEDYLTQNQMTRDELVYEFEWRLAWRKFLEQELNDTRRAEHYHRYQRKFDGTQMKVAHLLLSPGDADVQQTLAQARQIRQSIVEQRITWKDAVEQHSIASSSKPIGGEIGWIDYHGPMVPEFCQAAMRLHLNDISEPVQTKFGIHLIRCLEIQPGKIGAHDAAESIRKDLSRHLFDSIANSRRSSADIKILAE